MKTLGSTLHFLTLTLIVSMSAISCVPVFSDLQSARTVGKGHFEATPYYTNTGSDSDDSGASHLGANMAFGLSDKVDIRGRIEQNWVNGEDGTGSTIIGFGPKVSLMENRIAAFLPFGSDLSSSTWQMQPTMLFTLPFAQDKLEATVAPKYIVSFCEDCGSNFATNFGLGYSPDFNKWALRAEYGRFFEEDGGIGQFSLGFSFVVNPKD